MTKPNADPIYTMGRSEGETERLISQSLLYEGVTLRFFREAGVAPGMKALDVGNDFDVVAGRLVLMYMADPAEALRGFAQRLRPGGVVAFQEADLARYRTFEHPDTPLMNQLTDWVIEVFERSGAATDMAFNLYRTFVDAGLPAPTMHYEALAGGADGWAGYPYAVQAFASFLPLFEQFGIATAEDVGLDTLEDRIREEVKTSKRPLLLPPHMTAYARVG